MGDQKRQKLRYVLVSWVAGAAGAAGVAGAAGGRVHWVQVVQGAGSAGGLSWCVPSLSPCLLSAFLLCLPAIPAKYALFRVLRAFLEGFSCSVWVCLAWVLCVACVAFVRVSG